MYVASNLVAYIRMYYTISKVTNNVHFAEGTNLLDVETESCMYMYVICTTM